MYVLATTDITFDCAVEFLKNLDKSIKFNYNKSEKLRVNISSSKEWIMNMCDAVNASNEAIHNRAVLEENKRYEYVKSLCSKVSKNVSMASDMREKMESMVRQIRTLDTSDAINLLLAHGFNIGKDGKLIGNGEDVASEMLGIEKPEKKDDTQVCIESDLSSPSVDSEEVKVLG